LPLPDDWLVPVHPAARSNGPIPVAEYAAERPEPVGFVAGGFQCALFGLGPTGDDDQLVPDTDE
jgi:hypothetical protein